MAKKKAIEQEEVTGVDVIEQAMDEADDSMEGMGEELGTAITEALNADPDTTISDQDKTDDLESKSVEVIPDEVSDDDKQVDDKKTDEPAELDVETALKSDEQIAADKKAEEEAKDEEEKYQEPEGLSDSASQRFKRLVADNKEVVGRNTELEESSKVLADVVQSFGPVEPQEMQILAGFSRDLKGGTPEGLGRCWTVLQHYQTMLAGMLGKKTESFNPLDQHDDLKGRVDSAEITVEEALQQAEQRAGQHLTQNQEKLDHHTQAKNNMFKQVGQVVNTLESNWKQNPSYSEPLFIANKETGEKTSIQAILRGRTQQLGQMLQQGKASPQQVVDQLNADFQNLSAKAGQMAANKKPSVPDHVPLNPGGNLPSGRMTSGDPSGLAAMNAALGYE